MSKLPQHRWLPCGLPLGYVSHDVHLEAIGEMNSVGDTCGQNHLGRERVCVCVLYELSVAHDINIFLSVCLHDTDVMSSNHGRLRESLWEKPITS